MISDVNIYVNRAKCYACGICVDRCIMDNLRLSLAPCRTACPIHMNCQGYIRLIDQGKEREAAEEMHQYTPFGGILGWICTHPCEEACERKVLGDGSVHIRALKRYLAETYPDISFKPPEISLETGKQGVIVGSGPAGLMAAYVLRQRGHKVTMIEASNKPGGLLTHMIPDFRLPPSEVERAVKMLEEKGIQIETGKEVGRHVEMETLIERFDAVIIAVGAGSSARLGIPGEDLNNVTQALEILQKVKVGCKPSLGRSVIVIGGGNTAIDVALTCKRLGAADVKMVCLERSFEMPASPIGKQEAEEEGIIFENGWGPKRFFKNTNGKIGVALSRCLSLSDENGNFCPSLEDRCCLTLEADHVVLAIGQRVEPKSIPMDLLNSETGRFAADSLTFQSPKEGKVFVCGDCLTGTKSVVESMASGREAAISADRFMRGQGLRWGRNFWNGAYIKDYVTDLSQARGGPREDLDRIPVDRRDLRTPAEQVFSSERAKREAMRCLSCGRPAEVNRTCWYCLPCEIECPVNALQVRIPYLVR